jgi:hypothetical protein
MGNYAGLTVTTDDIASQLGRAVSNVGDFNGDGIDDFLVTAPEATIVDTTEQYGFYFTAARGATYVIFGTQDGPARLDVGDDFALGADDLDGTNGFRLSADEVDAGGFTNYSADFQSVGRFAAGIGDVNGDGLADIAVAGGRTTATTASGTRRSLGAARFRTTST